MPDPVPHDRLSANRVFDALEHLPDLPGHTVVRGIRDEERSTSATPNPCSTPHGGGSRPPDPPRRALR